MSFEVSCSQCQGRLRVEQPGLVACPHCGTRLNVAEPSAADVPAAVPQAAVPQVPVPAVAEVPAPAPAFAQPPAPVAPAPVAAAPAPVAPAPAAPVPTAGAPQVVADSPAPPQAGEQMPYLGEMGMPGPEAEEESHADSALDDEDNESVLPGEMQAAAPSPATAPVPAPATATVAPAVAPATGFPTFAAGPAVDVSDSSGSVLPQPDSVIHAGPSSSIIHKYTTEKLKGTVSKKWFALALSYSSAVTLAVLYLAWQVMNGGGSSSQLESLPDVKPKRKDNGDFAMLLVPESAVMPPGHTLALGESRRFGNLEVTPLKVARGPVQFEFYRRDDSQTKADGDEVLKLWLRFRNVSTDQQISPLDALLFRRDAAFETGEIDRANNFVCAATDKKKDGHRVLVYELNEDAAWNLRGQNLDFEIPPGETLDTYIPTTEEGVSDLLTADGPYVWRVHFRKGYSPQRYGVTTVVEVNFDKSEVVNGSAIEATDKADKADEAAPAEQS